MNQYHTKIKFKQYLFFQLKKSIVIILIGLNLC